MRFSSRLRIKPTLEFTGNKRVTDSERLLNVSNLFSYPQEKTVDKYRMDISIIVYHVGLYSLARLSTVVGMDGRSVLILVCPGMVDRDT